MFIQVQSMEATNRFHNTSSVSDMLQDLNLQTLQQRRLRTRLIFFYKIIHNLVAIYPTDLLHPQDSRTRHSNPHGFQQIHTSKDTCKFSFYPRTIVQWNMLPAHLVSIDKLDAFKEQVIIPVLQAIYHEAAPYHVHSFKLLFLTPHSAQRHVMVNGDRVCSLKEEDNSQL